YVRERLPIPVEVSPVGSDRCAFEPGSDYPEMLALYLGLLDADFTVVDSPELISALRTLAGRFQRAVDAEGALRLGGGGLAGGRAGWRAGWRAGLAGWLAVSISRPANPVSPGN
ncbi:MAG TPA: hypothetical protein VGS06_45710, partial [Streptosporangiaceae bacterium]|nr:hypothetical protein [Streptosporangiaceae bacterium]